MKILPVLLVLTLSAPSLAFEATEDTKSLNPLSNEDVANLFRNRDEDCSWEPRVEGGISKRNPQQLSCIVQKAIGPLIEKANFTGSFWVELDVPGAGGKTKARVIAESTLPEGFPSAVEAAIGREGVIHVVSEGVVGYRLWVHACFVGKRPVQVGKAMEAVPPWASSPIGLPSNFIRTVVVSPERKIPENCRGEP